MAARRIGRKLLLGLLLLSGPLWAQTWEPGKVTRLTGSDSKVTVLYGQSLYDVARQQGLALEHLAEANGLPVSLAALNTSSVLVPGRRILPADSPENGLIVNLPERGFYVFRKGEKAKFYPIAVGEPGRFETPTGRFSIVEKVVDPEWIAPEWAGLGEDNVVPAGPDNPLGDRWIGLTSSGLGMHSTNNPSSIGSATSHGCMRMYPEVARKVFDSVQTGWPVTIEYQTSRVSLEKDGIYLVCFPDPYQKVDRGAQLRERFRDLDLLGFYSLVDSEKHLQQKSGICQKVVDLEPRVVLSDGRSFPAARIASRVYVEGAALTELGVSQEFRLTEKSVVLTRDTQSVNLAMKLQEGTKANESSQAQAFLSRGGAWYPAKESLQALSIIYRWDGSQKKLIIETPVSAKE